MPKDDDGMLDKLDGRVDGGGFDSRVERVEREEVLDRINRIYRIGHRDDSRKGRKGLNHGGSE